MKQVFFLTISFFISAISFSQFERSDIIERKIKSVTKARYLITDTANKEVIQTFFSRAGDDSLTYYDGVLTFRFVATKDNNGKVIKLVRYDSRNQEDEWHTYKYNKNGSYSIEIMAQGAGIISLARYDKKNLCMEEEVESSYTLVYVRNANGKTEKILSKEKDNKTETIAVFYFDKNGLAIKGEGTTEGGKTVYFKYNDQRLVSEVKTVEKDENDKEQTEIVLLKYEFYE
jgi:hypothetical protein